MDKSLFASPETSEGDELLTLFPPRNEVLTSLRRKKRVDVLIVGGGIHGATLARLSALNGLSTVLLERSDYASGTSSRSSKMAHGGLRYLEHFDLSQVFSGIRAREDLYESASHVVRPSRFLFPIRRGDWFSKVKLRVGLSLYDLFLRKSANKHKWLAGEEVPKDLLSGWSLSGCFSYTDGLMNDTRLVLENVVAARQEGAIALNHVLVKSLGERRDSGVDVGWRDELSGDSGEIAAGIVVNCAGPWVPWVGRLKASELRSQLRYSRGVHLLFNKSWSYPSLCIPLREKGRYYFVWPHAGGTLVGTTEREVEEPEDDPIPNPDEVQEILDRLSKDLPDSGLDRSALYYGYAGIRTLPVRGSGGNTASISRKHKWIWSSGVLTLLGGKFTTASWTAKEGLEKIYALAGLGSKPVSLKGRVLPGAWRFKEETEEFRELCASSGISEQIAARIIGRLGSWVRFLPKFDRGMDLIKGGLLRGEISLGVKIEQAERVEDLLCRRLELEMLPGNGLEFLDEIGTALEDLRSPERVKIEVEAYRSRVLATRKTLGLP